MPLISPVFCPPIVLTFAGSDPSGGAGVQADIMTLTSLGCHALSVITALTVQDTVGVRGVMPVDPRWVEEQARCLLADLPVAAFKIGMLGSAENVAVVAGLLADYPDVPLIFDPVLASGRGDALADEAMLDAIRDRLLPRTTVLTPNSLEARRLAGIIRVLDSGEDASDSLALGECARRLISSGCQHVLLTGTHENTLQVVNELYGHDGSVHSARWQRLPGSYHGSGCTLASAVAAGIAHGRSVGDAVREAQDYTWHSLANGFHPGAGQFIPDRFFRWRASAGGGRGGQQSFEGEKA